MLHSRRKRLEILAEEEARGSSFWTAEFSAAVRIKLLHAFRDATEHIHAIAAGRARGLILRDEGLFTLAGISDPSEDFFQFACGAPSEMMPTVIEAMYKTLTLTVAERRYPVEPHFFHRTVEEVLREHRVSFDIIDGKMIEFASREMHVSVVAPVLQLLAGRSEYSNVEKSYQDSLSEISQGKGADAITDAGTALQELLTALGCKGNALGPLIKSGRTKGLFAAHDTRMLEVIEGLLNWVSADRSETGDAHSADESTIEDAWLTVHVVGALILRLTGSVPRVGVQKVRSG